MVQPRADVLKRVQLRVIGKDHEATTEPTFFAHDWTPVTEQALKVSSARSSSTQNITSNAFLRNNVRRDWSLVLFVAHVSLPFGVSTNWKINSFYSHHFWTAKHDLATLSMPRRTHCDFFVVFAHYIENNSIPRDGADLDGGTQLVCKSPSKNCSSTHGVIGLTLLSGTFVFIDNAHPSSNASKFFHGIVVGGSFSLVAAISVALGFIFVGGFSPSVAVALLLFSHWTA